MKQENTKKRPKKEKWNFTPWLIVAAVILAIVGITFIYMSLTAKDKTEVLHFKYDNGAYVDTENKITYVRAPSCYEAKLTTSIEFPYADSDKLTLYRVGYRDSDDKAHIVSESQWLSTHKNDGGQLYYNADKVDLPDIDEFEGDTIYVCDSNGAFTTTKLDGSEATDLLDAYFASEGSSYEEHYFDCELVSNLKISSSKYYWMYLNLWLYRDSANNYYIYENSSGKFAETNAAVFEPIFRETTES